MQLKYIHGVLLVLLAGVFWSSMGIGIRSISEANVWQILLYRSVSLACFLLLVIRFRSGGKTVAAIRRTGLAGVIGGWGLVLAFSGGIYAIQTTTVANAMFLFAAAPFMAAILARILLGESVRVSTRFAVVGAMLGIFIMVADGFSSGQLSGNLSALASALGFSIFTIALRWGKLEDMIPAVFLAGLFGSFVALVICLLNEFDLVLTPADAAIAVAMGVFQVGLGLVIFTLGSRVVPAAELALLSMTEVLLGPLWVWLLLGETAGLLTLAGGSILMFAIVFNALTGLRNKPVPVL